MTNNTYRVHLPKTQLGSTPPIPDILHAEVVEVGPYDGKINRRIIMLNEQGQKSDFLDEEIIYNSDPSKSEMEMVQDVIEKQLRQIHGLKGNKIGVVITPL